MEVMRLGLVPYDDAWRLQRCLADRRIAAEVDDTLILLEHPGVYTAGRRTQPWERPVDGTPVVDVDRGGKITWHGPGQLVGYPVVRLPEPLDLVAYVRTLEAGLIAACADLGLATTRVAGRTGVWTTDGERKIAAIGVRVRRRVAYHGFALNCCPDLTAFTRIVPCGITDAAVTSLSRELARTVTLPEALPIVEDHMVDVLSAFTTRTTVPRTLPVSTSGSHKPVRGTEAVREAEMSG
nr:lipoyl(octanoyl) transferase LipB [Frankia sp. Cas4]